MAKTPAGQQRTGPEKVDSKPDARNKAAVPTIGTLEVATEDQEPNDRKRSGSSGAQGITQAEIDATAFEEPVRTDTVKSFGNNEEA